MWKISDFERYEWERSNELLAKWMHDYIFSEELPTLETALKMREDFNKI
jgi:hypothetical protein